jgi:hypothetical protein
LFVTNNPERAPGSVTAERAASVRLEPEVVAGLRTLLPGVAEDVVAAIVAEVPSYTRAFGGPMGRTIESAVQTALGTFLDLASGEGTTSDGGRIGPGLRAAYELGRGEARGGRTMDALLSAYRVGARVSWREMSRAGVRSGISAETLALFAELVFAYIDELSAASVAGHAEESATAGRLRERRLDRLAFTILAGEPEEDLRRRADLADWPPPATLTVVLLPEAHAHTVRGMLDPRTLVVTEDLPDLDPDEGLVAVLVPDAGGGARATLLHLLRDRRAVVGPARPWTRAGTSWTRALGAHRMTGQDAGSAAYDTDEHLSDLVLASDPAALADLRARVLTPLDDVSDTTREKLTETLRSWLLHHGRREAIAEELYVHPQTVRYRMQQLRELFGDALTDPRSVLDLTVALCGPGGRNRDA